MELYQFDDFRDEYIFKLNPMAAWAKEEGLTAALFALAGGALLTIWGMRSALLRRGRWRPLAWCAAGFVVSILPWLLLRRRSKDLGASR